MAASQEFHRGGTTVRAAQRIVRCIDTGNPRTLRDLRDLRPQLIGNYPKFLM